jgi:flagellar biosynthesis protein FlhA
MGYTVVDASTVVATHLSSVIQAHAAELLGREEMQALLDHLSKEAPKLVEDVVPGTISLGELVRVLRGLLREGVSVRDMRTVLEAVADGASRSKDTAWLVECARRRLARQITGRVSGSDGVVRALTLDRGTEDLLRQSLGASDGETALAPPDLRRPIHDFASRFVPDLWVVSARELVPGTAVEPAGVLQALPLALEGSAAA